MMAEKQYQIKKHKKDVQEIEKEIQKLKDKKSE